MACCRGAVGVQARARLLKVHHEKDRNRTRERALLHIEQLVEVLMLPPEEQQGQDGAGDSTAHLQGACPAHPPVCSSCGRCHAPGGSPLLAGAQPLVGDNGTGLLCCAWGVLTHGRAARRGGAGAGEAEAARRLPYVHCSALPLAARLRRELAHQYLALGFVGEPWHRLSSLSSTLALQQRA